jgi:superfamily II DNA or RNA helicase
MRAASHGGPPIPSNGEAWCGPCNWKNQDRDVRDTRVTPRPWQHEALPIVLEALAMQKVATVMAAPGAGKTIFAGLVFAAGQHAGRWNRLLVLVPRLPLVEQWADDLLESYHIELDTYTGARTTGLELEKTDGICMTYQALLMPRVQELHRRAMARTPTLVVLDEVHHLGEPVQKDEDPRAWASAVREVVGDLEVGLNVAGVMNLSGTLFRTSPRERISTVQYTDVVGEQDAPRIEAIANYAIHPERLVREGVLRPPDLYRLDAKVELVNLASAEMTSARVADLTDDAEKRVTLRRLPQTPEWISHMVAVTLRQLRKRHEDSKGAPVKALIVASRQTMAAAFAEEVNRQMKAAGLQPLAECVVSADGADAYRRLDAFRKKDRVGVLCTVGMAGEGYNCPDIAVITYATNIQTVQYVRQVVARGQRVTEREKRNGQVLTTAIILPDVQGLVDLFTDILAPMVHNIAAPTDGASNPTVGPDKTPSGSPAAPAWSDTDLVGVHDPAVNIVSTVGTGGTFDVNPIYEEVVGPALREVDLPQTWWPRVTHAIQALDVRRPFQPAILGATPTAVIEGGDPVRRPLTQREHHQVYRDRFKQAHKWWAAIPARSGGQAIDHFIAEIKEKAGIRDIDRATPEQLKRACSIALSRIREWCDRMGTRLPRWARAVEDES